MEGPPWFADTKVNDLNTTQRGTETFVVGGNLSSFSFLLNFVWEGRDRVYHFLAN